MAKVSIARCRIKDPNPRRRPGDGLSNMCQRLADMGGHCTIESAPGQGTNIHFVIPLNYPAKDV